MDMSSIAQATPKAPKRYAIASYLPLEGRRVAVEAEYQPIPRSDGGAVLWRNADYWCPLGLALRDVAPEITESPDSEQVAEALVDDPDSDLFWEVMGAADEFINDWDSEMIEPADLPAIFEVSE